MIIYLCIGLVTSALSFCAVRESRKSKKTSTLLLLLIIWIFVFFAGARDLSVGTDVTVYGIKSYEIAKMSSLEGFFFDSIYSSWGPICKLVIWIASNIGNSFFWYLAIVQLFTVIPLVWSTYSFCGRAFPFAIFIYALIFYPISFNAMRQIMSLPYLLAAFVCYDRNKTGFSVVLTSIAVGIHSSSLVGFLVYPLCAFADNKKFSISLKLVMLGLVMFVVVSFSDSILKWFTILTGLYTEYVSGVGAVSGGGLRTVAALMCVMITIAFAAIVFLHNVDISLQKERNISRLASLCIVGVASWSMSLLSFWLYRVGLIFCFYSILFFPVLLDSISCRREKNFLAILIAFMLVMFSFDYLVVQGSHEVVPYEFSNPSSRLI